MPAKLIKRGEVYSNRVMLRLDAQRPKYSEAVKSLSAFVDTYVGDLYGRNELFEVLAGHLDAACREATLTQVFDEEPTPMWSDAVKNLARRIDPDCWVSYSGRPKAYKQVMDQRRTAALERAKSQLQYGR